MTRLLSFLTVFPLVVAATVPAQATPKPKTRTEYVISETNPFTGGAESTKRFTDRNAANAYYARVSKAHWVFWRFVGINEPARFRRFESSYVAQRFIDNDGPTKSGKLGVALLTNETRNVPTKVKLTAVVVPITDGGSGGGNGRPDVGQVIDRLIGIIDR